jgi:cardiolipin synthase A/B
LEAGVKLYKRLNALLHAKTAVIDSVWSTVGSTNMDFWRLLNDNEVNAIVLSHQFAAQMEMMFATDIEESDAINLEAWAKRPYLQRMREQFAHLFVRWL